MPANHKQVRQTIDYIKQRIKRRRAVAENTPVRFLLATIQRPAVEDVSGKKITVRPPNGVIVETNNDLNLPALLEAAAAL